MRKKYANAASLVCSGLPRVEGEGGVVAAVKTGDFPRFPRFNSISTETPLSHPSLRILNAVRFYNIHEITES